MKDLIVAKLASACEDLYAECLKTFQRENLKSIWEKDWVPMVILINYRSLCAINNSLIDCRKASWF